MNTSKKPQEKDVLAGDAKPQEGSRTLTPGEHRKRHIELHRALDELYADYLAHNMPHPGARRYSSFFPVTVNDLAAWSYKQTLCPDELPHD